jgi:hypothetical protein
MNYFWYTRIGVGIGVIPEMVRNAASMIIKDLLLL